MDRTTNAVANIHQPVCSEYCISAAQFYLNVRKFCSSQYVPECKALIIPEQPLIQSVVKERTLTFS